MSEHHALSTAIIQTLTNEPGQAVRTAQCVAGVLGDHPSQYSRSPAIWNNAFSELGLQARYTAFDVPEDRLTDFVSALRDSPGVLGINVTVPYKQRIMPLLDELDLLATAIGATNCIIRTEDGRLLGTNTDAEGALSCLILPRPSAPPFFRQLGGSTVLLVGTGGAGRAVASVLIPRLGERGRLFLTNRTPDNAINLARTIDPTGVRVTPVLENDIPQIAPGVDLVINASTRGQAGFFLNPDGSVSCLEPYSPLGPAQPAHVNRPTDAGALEPWREWFAQTLEDLRENELRASQILALFPSRTRFFDLIYAPAETTFLRMARWAGHPTLNGADMILHQAVAGFLLICEPLLREQDRPELRETIEAAMRATPPA